MVNGYNSNVNIKTWVRQLAKAVEMLNVARGAAQGAAGATARSSATGGEQKELRRQPGGRLFDRVLIFFLLTKSNLFRLSIGAENYLFQWHNCPIRPYLPGHYRSLLDDIFKDWAERLTSFDLKRDQCLHYSSDVFEKDYVATFLSNRFGRKA